MANDERGNRNVPVAEVDEPHFGNLRTTKEWQANARLIAAAPELLAACRYFSALCDGNKVPNRHEIEMLRAAIAKATSQ